MLFIRNTQRHLANRAPRVKLNKITHDQFNFKRINLTYKSSQRFSKSSKPNVIVSFVCTVNDSRPYKQQFYYSDIHTTSSIITRSSLIPGRIPICVSIIGKQTELSLL